MDAAVKGHSALGSGLLESVYEAALFKRMVNGLNDANLRAFGSSREALPGLPPVMPDRWSGFSAFQGGVAALTWRGAPA
ncbi:MAG: hypothetical protein ACFE0O_12085 [Opitutales bacterium]